MARIAPKIPESAKMEASDIETEPTRLEELAQISALAPLVAANPATSAETLRVLAAMGNATVQAAVAENPNAAFSTLQILLAAHTERVLNNPALPFLLMENPALPAKLSSDDLLHMLRYERMPRAFLAHALYLPDGTVRQQAMSHVTVAGEVGPNWRDELMRQFGETVVLQSTDLPFFRVPDLLPATVLATLSERAAYHDFVAQSPDLTPAICDVLVDGQNEIALAFLAQNPSATPQALARLVTVASAETRATAAAHPRLLPATLGVLAGDHAPAVRAAVARNAATMPDVLRHLAHDPAVAVREAVAAHASTPPECLADLAHDAHAPVHQQVAMNSRTPPPLLEALAHDPQVQVRAAVVQHPSTPRATFEQLAREDVPEMAEALAASALLTTEIARRLLATKLARLHERVAANPALSADLLAKLLQQLSEPAYVRGLARNPQTPAETLIWLAGHKNYAIRRVIAAHPRLPFAAQGRLVESRDFETQLALAHNPATTLTILARLGERTEPALFIAIAGHPAMNAATRRTIYAQYFAALLDKNTEATAKMRMFALLADVAPVPARTTRFDAIDWLDRFELAHSVHSPKWMLVRLNQDGNRFVRAAARMSLAQRQATLVRENL